MFIFLKFAWLFETFCGSIQILGQFFSISVESVIGVLIGIALNLYIVLGSMDLKKIIYPVKNMGYLSVYLCSCQLLSSV